MNQEDQIWQYVLAAKFSEAGTLRNLLDGALHTSLCTEILTITTSYQ